MDNTEKYASEDCLQKTLVRSINIEHNHINNTNTLIILYNTLLAKISACILNISLTVSPACVKLRPLLCHRHVRAQRSGKGTVLKQREGTET